MLTLQSLQKTKNPEELAAYFGYKDYKSFARIIFGTPVSKRYRIFKIPKKSNGERLIEAPNKSISVLQKMLLPVFTVAYKPHPSAFAYINGKSSLQNARRHSGARTILNIDLKDYFHSIHFGRVQGLLRKKPFDFQPKVASIIANICCFNQHLPQGAPTSPIIANLITARMDREFFSLAKQYRCIYTRYADDITFSFTINKSKIPIEFVVLKGNSIEIGQKVQEIIDSNGFTVNKNKVHLCGSSNRLEVTGIILNANPNVRRCFVRKISSTLNAWQKHGYENAEEEHLNKYYKKIRASNVKPKLHRIIHGKLSYLKFVRGSSDNIYIKLAKKYNNLKTETMPLLTYDETLTRSEILDRTVLVIESGSNQGSGFFLRGVGLVTCFHVIKKNQDILVNFPGKQSHRAVISHFCKHRDIAVLSLQDGSYGEYFLEANKNSVGMGMEIIITGFPQHSPGKSIFVCTARVVAEAKISGVEGFEVDMQIRKGNSGGPVITTQGDVIGIAAEGSFGNAGHNRFISISEVYSLLKEKGSFENTALEEVPNISSL